MRVRLMFAVVCGAVVALGSAPAAHATMPGPVGALSFLQYSPTFDSGEVWRVNPDGSGLMQLTHSGGSGFYAAESDWSPGGGRIAFDSDRVNSAPGTVQIYTADNMGGDVHQITSGDGFHGDPAWSPAGTQLAIESDWGSDADEGIWLVLSAPAGGVTKAQATKVVGRVGGAVAVGEPQFSPGGQWLTFTAFRDCRFQDRSAHPQLTGCTQAIYRVRPDGGGVQRLTAWGQQNSFSDWSPDGQWIAYDSADVGKQGFAGSIYVMRPDGSGKRRVIAGSPTINGGLGKGGQTVNYVNNPVFSPVGDRLAYVNFIGADTTRLVLSGADGSAPHAILDDAFRNRPDWGSAPLLAAP